MTMDPVHSARSRLALMSRYANKSSEEFEAARQELTAAKLERAITAAITPSGEYQPLNEEHRKRLADILLDRKFYFRKK